MLSTVQDEEEAIASAKSKAFRNEKQPTQGKWDQTIFHWIYVCGDLVKSTRLSCACFALTMSTSARSRNKPIIFTSTINIIIFIHVYETLRTEQLVRLTNNHTSAQCTQRETFPVSTWPISLRIHFFLWQYSTTIICFKQTSHTLQTSVRSISTLQLNL